MGSGSTAIAAAAADRRYVGYELSPEYAEIARERIEAATEETAQNGAVK